MPLVSVIVPAYNAENTLSKTICDIVGQTYDDFELIIVNDGSTDKTQDICDEFLRKDKRIKVISQTNSGPSIARNNGVSVASSEYITFIDADDRVEKYYLEFLITALKQSKADMVCARTDRVKEGYEPNGVIQNYRLEVFSQKESLREMLTGKRITVGPCHRLAPRSWYIKYPFLEGKKYEDLSNTYKLHLQANTVAFVEACIYHYVMRGGSITGSKEVSAKQCEDYYEAISLCTNDVFFRYKDLVDDIAVLKFRDYMSLFLLINRCSESNVRLDRMKLDIVNWCNSNWKRAFSNFKAPITVRLRVLLFRLSPILYKRIYYIGIRFKGKAIS